MKRGFLLLLLAVGTVLIAACAAQGQPATTGQSSSSGPIKIGVVMDQTGSASYYSKESEKGIQLAVEQINAAGGVDGRMLELVIEDDQNDPAQSAQKVRKLASDREVVAVLSVSGSASALQNQVAAEEEKIPEIAPTNIANSLTQEFRSYFFRLGAADSHYVEVIMSTAADQFTKVTVIGDNTQTGLATRDSWVQSLRDKGVEVVAVEQIDAGATDATAQVLNMKNAGAELVLLTGQGAPELALITRTIRQQNWDVAIMGGLTIGGAPAFLDLAKDAANGILFTDLIDDEKPELQEFKKNFLAKYGEDQTITANASLSYDGVYLLADAIRDGGATREGIRGALEKVSAWDKGVSGRTGSTASFGPNDHQGYDETAVVIRTFKDQEPAKYK